MSMNATDTHVAVTPMFAIPAAHEAIARVNRWLHRDLGTAVHATSATFDPATFYWHIPIELAYGASGPLGTVGSGWSEMCKSSRRRITSPGDPMPRNFASEQRLWLLRTGSSDGELAWLGTSVFVCRSL